MTNKDVIEMVQKHLVPIATENGLDIYDIEFVKEGPNWYFRIYIEKAQCDNDGESKTEGIGIDDCELISRAAEKFLDEKDPITQAYMLEVSSPGLDRPLKKDADFQRHIGYEVEIKLFKADEGRKVWDGLLTAFDNETLTIDTALQERIFKRVDVASCRLAVIL